MPRPREVDDDRVVRFIHDYRENHGYAPSVRNIAEHFGVAPSSVQLRLTSLIENGALERPSGIPRALFITPVGMKMITERL